METNQNATNINHQLSMLLTISSQLSRRSKAQSQWLWIQGQKEKRKSIVSVFVLSIIYLQHKTLRVV